MACVPVLRFLSRMSPSVQAIRHHLLLTGRPNAVSPGQHHALMLPMLSHRVIVRPPPGLWRSL